MSTRRLFLARCGGAAGGLFLVSRAGLAQDPQFALAQIDDDVVLKAMRDEMDRSRQLRVVGGEDAPYFFSFDFTDSEDFHVVASLGSVLEVQQRHMRNPSAEVRVGSYQFDNTGHIYSGRYSGSRYDGNWPQDDNYDGLREGFWLLTDRTFKAAVESIGRKRASLKNTATPADQLPDYSKADPIVSLPKVSHQKTDASALSQRVARLSSVFASYPEVLASNVELQVIDGITRLINSEGTAIRYADRIDYVVARAEGQAQDGMLVRDALSIQALDIGKLPSEEEMRKQIAGIADHVRDLQKAPAGEGYTGPVLFEPMAAAQLMAQLVGDNLRVTRKPIADGRNVNVITSEFESKVGSRVLPDWMDVTDDPTQTSWNGKPLAGYYQFDLEGVPPKAVKVIEKGVFKSFLTTRQPIKGFSSTNGHARLSGAFGNEAAAIGNLLVTASEKAPLADLKKRAIQMAMDRSKPYAMVVRKLDFPYSSTQADLQALMQSSQQSGGSARPLSPPILIYRVYPDGREELVRGLRFRGVSSRALRDILAASEESAMYDFINNSAPLALLGYGGYIAATSVVSPGLLFEEMELELPQEPLQKRPIVPPPASS